MKHVWVYGLNPVLEALRAGRAKEVYLSSRRHEKLSQIEHEIGSREVPVRIVDIKFFNDTFPKGHQGIAAKVFSREYVDIEDLLDIPKEKGEQPFFLILDGIEDPRNFGAILRSAEAAGVHGIVIQKHRAAGLSSGILSKTSAGAVEYVPVSQVSNIKHAISEMKMIGITVIGAEAGSEIELWDTDMSVPLAVVIGSEGKGLRKTVAEKCDFLVSLPMKGRINSLNASVAAAILIFEVLRQRRRNN